MVERKKCDIAVIGAGPGGYVAAIQAAQLGKSTALIEKGFLGGTCLNVGCIPSKALLSHAAVLHQVRRAAEFGISTGPISFQYEKMKGRKDEVVAKIRRGLEGLIQANKIAVYRGMAQFESARELKISGQDNLYLSADKIIIATGSVPLDIPAFPCDHVRILNSTSLLEVTRVPKSLAIVGGGYIGCEFASLFAELESQVTILEALPAILTAQGPQIGEFMTQSFAAHGIEIQTNAVVKEIQTATAGVQIVLGEGKKLNAELALIAVGRKVYTEGLKFEKAGLRTGERGILIVNDQMETEVPGIYAIGDVTGKWMLAHVASHQGRVAALHACGFEAKMRYEAVPAVVFTSPEIATVGWTLEQAQKEGFRAVQGRFPFQALGKAQAVLETEGFVQIVSDEKTGQILGATAIGCEASNLIAEMALAIQNELTLDSILETIHAHPTFAEAWHEAAAIAKGMPIHLPPKVPR